MNIVWCIVCLPQERNHVAGQPNVFYLTLVHHHIRHQSRSIRSVFDDDIPKECFDEQQLPTSRRTFQTPTSNYNATCL